MPRSKITKRTLDAAEPGERDYFVWDTSFAGFGFRVSTKGRKTFVYQYRITAPGEAAQTPPVRYTIGRYGNITPEQARKSAEKLAGMVANGIDPRSQDKERATAAKEAKQVALQRERLEGELAFANYADRWLDYYEHQKARRPSSVSLAKLVVENYLKPNLRDKPMPHIGRSDLQQIFDDIPKAKRAMRRAVYSYASILWGWALRRGDVPSNPLTVMEKPAAPPAREHVLTDFEVKLFWQATHKLSAPFDSFARILLLTGQRRSEVSGMAWSELDRASAIWTIPKVRAKNKAANIVPLSWPIMVELDALAMKAWGGSWPDDKPAWPIEGLVLTTTGKTPISGLSKAKAKLDAEMVKLADQRRVEPWRFHDLRRTVATSMQRLGVRLEVTEAALHHLSGSRAGIVGVYQRHDWKDEKRAALEAWAAHIEVIVSNRNDENMVRSGTTEKLFSPAV